MLGYPKQAVKIFSAALDHARRVAHPFMLGWALIVGGAELFDFLGEADEGLRHTEEGARLARENSLPFLTECMARASSGIALVRKGQTAEGVSSLEPGIAVWNATGGQMVQPRFKSVLAEGRAQLGDLAGAIALIDEVIAQIERPGWEERWYYAETLRIKGWLLSLMGDPPGAERAYLASLDWARTQQAKSWELRTATSYARLLRDQGRAREAHELLAPIYGWFTEGFGTRDLREAKALLDELAAILPLRPPGRRGQISRAH
jgi:predicted ATPase